MNVRERMRKRVQTQFSNLFHDSNCRNWLRALLTTQFVVRGKMIVESPLLELFRPRVGQRAVVTLQSDGKDGTIPVSLAIYDSKMMRGARNSGYFSFLLLFCPLYFCLYWSTSFLLRDLFCPTLFVHGILKKLKAAFF